MAKNDSTTSFLFCLGSAMHSSLCRHHLLWATIAPATRPSERSAMKLVLIAQWLSTVAKMQKRHSETSKAMRSVIRSSTLANTIRAFVACAPTHRQSPSWPNRTGKSENLSLSTSRWDRPSDPFPRAHQDLQRASRQSLSRTWTRWGTRRTPMNVDKTRAVMSTLNRTAKLSTVSSPGLTLCVSVAASTQASRHTVQTSLSLTRRRRRKSNRSLDPSSKVTPYIWATISALEEETAPPKKATSKRWNRIPCSTVRTLQQASGRAWRTGRAWWTPPRWTTLAILALSDATSSEEEKMVGVKNPTVSTTTVTSGLQAGRKSLTNNFANDKSRLIGYTQHLDCDRSRSVWQADFSGKNSFCLRWWHCLRVEIYAFVLSLKIILVCILQ